MSGKKTFSDLLLEMEDGRLDHHLTALYHQILEATLDVRTPGKLTIDIEFEVSGRGTVTVQPKVKTKIPEHSRSSTTFFYDPQSKSLRRDDPNQPKFDFEQRRDGREVYEPDGEDR